MQCSPGASGRHASTRNHRCRGKKVLSAKSTRKAGRVTMAANQQRRGPCKVGDLVQPWLRRLLILAFVFTQEPILAGGRSSGAGLVAGRSLLVATALRLLLQYVHTLSILLCSCLHSALTTARRRILPRDSPCPPNTRQMSILLIDPTIATVYIGNSFM